MKGCQNTFLELLELRNEPRRLLKRDTSFGLGYIIIYILFNGSCIKNSNLYKIIEILCKG